MGHPLLCHNWDVLREVHALFAAGRSVFAHFWGGYAAAVGSVAAADGSERLPLQSLELQRQLTLSGQDELGYRNEAALLRIDMRLDMADQVIRRLQAQLR